MLVVQALGQFDDAGRSGHAAGCGSLDRGSGNGLDDGGSRLLDDLRGRGLTGLVRSELRLQLFVLGDRLTPLDDDFVQEVVDLIRVETLLESHVLELLRDDVFRGQSHGVSSFGAHDAGRFGRPATGEPY